jgi:hypothetical protein
MNVDFLEEIWAKGRITHKVLAKCGVVAFLDLLHYLFYL